MKKPKPRLAWVVEHLFQGCWETCKEPFRTKRAAQLAASSMENFSNMEHRVRPLNAREKGKLSYRARETWGKT